MCLGQIQIHQFPEYVTLVQNLCCYLDFSLDNNYDASSHWTDQLLNHLDVIVLQLRVFESFRIFSIQCSCRYKKRLNQVYELLLKNISLAQSNFTYRGSRPETFNRIAVLYIFAKVSQNNQQMCIIFSNVAELGLQIFKKQDSIANVSL